MDPHLLRTFVTVVRRRSFSAAAEELGYTQSAVSQQIAALEADLGLPLLRRRPVAPTRAGERLLEHARPLLLRHRAARADVLRAAAGPAGRLTVTASPLALVPAVVRALEPGGPAVTLRTADRDRVAEEVASGDADLGFADGIAAPSDPLRLAGTGAPTGVGIAEEELVVVLPARHPLAGGRGLALAGLADALWLHAPAFVPVERLREVAGGGAFRTGFRYDGHDLRTVLKLVAAGHGLALLPASAAADAGAGALTAVPLTAPRLVHRVEMLCDPLASGEVRAVADRLGA
ncbi:LysR family transcriptional regulator [Streptosporangium sp. NPDC004379]|uniref:LysR family transcriptional regulator n=1 Tax=Streptosporangium sp. NPDC004379 TaxID=3366189 RepID=UPI003677634D